MAEERNHHNNNAVADSSSSNDNHIDRFNGNAGHQPEPRTRSADAILQPLPPLDDGWGEDSLTFQSTKRLTSSLPSRIEVPDADDDVEPAVSWTSTDYYDQEPFETYQNRVRTLCGKLWPQSSFSYFNRFLRSFSNTRAAIYLKQFKFVDKFLPESDPFSITQLKGGSYNRITGVTIAGLASSNWFLSRPPLDLVLRVPRDAKQSNIPREVANVQFVQHFTDIPVPGVIVKDFSSNNALETPYVFYKRMPGRSMDYVWNDLNHQQRCSVARQIGSILNEMQRVHVAAPGLIDSFSANEKGVSVQMAPLELSWLDGESCPLDESKHPAFNYQTKDYGRDYLWMTSIILQRSAMALKKLGEDTWHMSFCDEIEEMQDEMAEHGLFHHDQNMLCHLDFQQRNILIDVTSDGAAVVTAVLDWDLAILAPRFVGCVAPWWMWSWKGYKEDIYDEGDETQAGSEPEIVKCAEIKRAFDESVGPRFRKYAYQKEYQMVRRFFKYGAQGDMRSELFDQVDDLKAEWFKGGRDQDW